MPIINSSFKDISITDNGTYITLEIDGETFNIAKGTIKYSGNIVAGGSYSGMYSNNIYIKFGSAPSSASDCDAYVDYSSPTTLQGISSYSNQTDAYIWGRGAYTIGSGSQQTLSGNTTYSLALHITLSSNANITLKPMITDAPGPKDYF